MASLGNPQYIADGFKDDCTRLLSKFEETNSARFADFVKVWQEMKFSMIYCGMSSFAELLEFTEEALSISKQFFLPPNSDISRIGALYLLYGVYTQQPTRGLVKIRMTPEDWMYTTVFIDNVREYGYADANFIFHYLCYCAAFMFTACNKEYGLERSYRRHQITSNHMREMMQCRDLTTNQILKPVFEDINVEELENSRLNYENLKSILAAKGESQGMEFTSVTPLEDIVSTLKRVVNSFIPDQADAGGSNSNPTADTSSQPESAASSSKNKDIGKDRQDLKQRAFKRKSVGQNHLKSCLPAAETAEKPVEPAEMPSISGSSGEPPEITIKARTGTSPVNKMYERSIFRREPKPRIKAKKGSKAQCLPEFDGVERSESDVDEPDPLAVGEDATPSENSEIINKVCEENSEDPIKITLDEGARRSKRICHPPSRYT